MKVAFDLDGVVYDLISPWDSFMENNKFSIVNKESYDIPTRHGVPGLDWSKMLHKFAKTRPFKK